MDLPILPVGHKSSAVAIMLMLENTTVVLL